MCCFFYSDIRNIIRIWNIIILLKVCFLRLDFATMQLKGLKRSHLTMYTLNIKTPKKYHKRISEKDIIKRQNLQKYQIYFLRPWDGHHSCRGGPERHHRGFCSCSWPVQVLLICKLIVVSYQINWESILIGTFAYFYSKPDPTRHDYFTISSPGAPPQPVICGTMQVVMIV